MKIEDWCTEIQKNLIAHENLVVAIEDFVNSALAEGPRKRLQEALKVSREIIDSND